MPKKSAGAGGGGIGGNQRIALSLILKYTEINVREKGCSEKSLSISFSVLIFLL